MLVAAKQNLFLLNPNILSYNNTEVLIVDSYF